MDGLAIHISPAVTLDANTQTRNDDVSCTLALVMVAPPSLRIVPCS